MKKVKITPEKLMELHEIDYLVMEPSGHWWSFSENPQKLARGWVIQDESWKFNEFYDIQWDGDWKESLHTRVKDRWFYVTGKETFKLSHDEPNGLLFLDCGNNQIIGHSRSLCKEVSSPDYKPKMRSMNESEMLHYCKENNAIHAFVRENGGVEFNKMLVMNGFGTQFVSPYKYQKEPNGGLFEFPEVEE